jgi:predicted protein tyrosine phosphatase
MFSPRWIVPGVLAISPMPCGEDVNAIARMFKCVVVLAEARELCYDVTALVSRGVKVLHKPVPDFEAPNLIELHDVVDFISSCGSPVLVHCLGGKGRSGTVAVAYIMASQGLDYEEALAMARRIVPGSVETRSQHRILKLYARLLKVVSPKLLSRAIEVGRRVSQEIACEEFGRGEGHASKVLELSIELVERLSSLGVLRFGLHTERALYIAALLHDIGVCWSADDSHREYTYRALLTRGEELDRTCGCSLADKAAIIARYHGASDPVPGDVGDEIKAEIGVIRIADGLDYTLDQVVEEIIAELVDNAIRLTVICRNRESCKAVIAKTVKKKAVLEEELGLKIQIRDYPGKT